MEKKLNIAIAWIKARWAEPSTKRSIWLIGCGLTAVVYAITNHEPSSAIVGAGTAIYGAMNAATPEV